MNYITYNFITNYKYTEKSSTSLSIPSLVYSRYCNQKLYSLPPPLLHIYMYHILDRTPRSNNFPHNNSNKTSNHIFPPPPKGTLKPLQKSQSKYRYPPKHTRTPSLRSPRSLTLPHTSSYNNEGN